MGYTTDFTGQFDLDKPLTDAHREYLLKFADTRRMGRNADKANKLNDPIRKAVGLPIGTEGEFFVGASGFAGQDVDDSVTDNNNPPHTQPGLWCKWIPNEDGTAIQWSTEEKFYYYTEWLQYIIINFLEPWGYLLNGQVQWQGEEPDDIGEISVENNEISLGKGETIYNY